MPRHIRAISLLTAAVLAVGILTAPVASAAVPRCFGTRATIVGTPRADVIVGTARRDVIVGLGGGDVIRGRGRPDLICGGNGGDTIKGGDGIDLIFGDAGNDRLLGGPGFFNQIVPGDGDDFVNGGPAEETAGDEVIYLDSPNGVVGDIAAGTVTGFGNDEIVNVEWLIGSPHDDVLSGSENTDAAFGAGGNDEIDLLGGDDFAAGGLGDDAMDGGEGHDIVDERQFAFGYGEPEPVGINVNLVAETMTGNGTDTLVDFEGSGGTTGDDVMVGNDEFNEFVFLTEGSDTVDAAGGDDIVDGGDGADDLDGGAGIDLLGNLDASEGMTIDLSAGTTSHGDTVAGFEDVFGTFFDDVITGDAGANMIAGTDGSDEIFGLGGNDVLFGGWDDGFDDGSPDSADGGDGTDQCDAETETNCEGDPVLPTSRWSVVGNWLRGTAYR